MLGDKLHALRLYSFEQLYEGCTPDCEACIGATGGHHDAALEQVALLEARHEADIERTAAGETEEGGAGPLLELTETLEGSLGKLILQRGTDVLWRYIYIAYWSSNVSREIRNLLARRDLWR
jgi:hypothetical protein